MNAPATPLSDRITRLLAGADPQRLADFHHAFLDAIVGLTMPEAPAQQPGTSFDASGMSLPLHRAPNGAPVFRVCADPDAFSLRFDPSLNVTLTGRAALEMVLKMGAEVQGVLVASAASEHSVLIPRADAARLLGEPPKPKRPWWKLW